MSRGDEGAEVDRLHHALRIIGLSSPATDRFGEATQSSVIRYQLEAGLEPDGIVGPITRFALIADVVASESAQWYDFRGRVGFIAAAEGHVGRPYFPGDLEAGTGLGSGVTLDPGYDLGRHHFHELEQIYGHLFELEQLGVLSRAIGKRGAEAAALVELPEFQAITIDADTAARLLPSIAVSYWRMLVAAVRAVALKQTPAAVQTAMLSLAYNAGVPRAARVGRYVAAADYRGLAKEIRALGRGKGRGIEARRGLEADLIEQGAGAGGVQI